MSDRMTIEEKTDRWNGKAEDEVNEKGTVWHINGMILNIPLYHLSPSSFIGFCLLYKELN